MPSSTRRLSGNPGNARIGPGACTGAVAWLATVLCCSPGSPEREPAAGAGSYVVLADSSRIVFVFHRDGEPAVGTFPRVVGSLTFQERTRGSLRASGSLAVDLAAGRLDDSTQTRALASELFKVHVNREFRTAELRVRDLFGKAFKNDLPPGDVTPISVRAQLVVHRMAFSRQFDGEISRTPSGYRITNAVPVLFSIDELGLEDELADWLEATGVREVGEGVAVTVDLRLARRPAVPS